MNYKHPGEPRLVTFDVCAPLRRYASLGDLDQHLPHVEKTPTLDEIARGDVSPSRGRRDVPQQIEEQTRITLLQRELPTTLTMALEAMRANDSRFNKTWEKKRTDFPKDDYSQSSYDLSLMMQCLSAKLSVQEVADIVCAYRRHYGRDTRLAYLRWTLQTALMCREERGGTRHARP